ncbi:MAG: glycosyltransferase family 39 protein [Chloroflexi bacterium]|nr:glycosyltransferase family 39 protein [Chloroflexota bacterium]
MSSRTSYALAVGLLLLAAVLRMWTLSALPPGLHDEEITDIRVAETARQGIIEVFYDLGGGEGREGLYHILLAAITSVTGTGLLGYQIVSVWVSLLTLALLYALATRLFGPLAGAAALALLVVNQWATLLGRSIGRETLLPLLAAGVLLALAQAFNVYRQGRRPPITLPFAALGMLLGLGFYIHPAHFMLVLASMAFISFMMRSRRRVSRRTLAYLGFGLLVMIIFATPYLISSLRLPQLSGAGRLLDNYTILQNPPMRAIGESLSGLFFVGDTNPLHNLPGRPLFDLVSGVLLLLGVLVALRNWRQPRYFLPLVFTLSLSPVAVLSLDTPDFQAMTGLLPLLALFFGLGVSRLYHNLPANSRHLLAAGLVALFIFNLVWTGRDLFQSWPNQEAVRQVYHSRIGQLARYLDTTADDLPTLICDSPSPASGRGLSSTDLLLLMMNRKQAPLRYADCGTGLVLMDGGARQQIIFPDAQMLHGMHPYLRRWISYGVLLDQPDLPANAVIEMTIERELADTIGRFITTAPVGYAPEAPGAPGVATAPIRFGGNITFLGYEREPTEIYVPGGILTFITYWRADGPIPPNLRLFTHVLADPASIAAQTDTISINVGSLRNRDILIQVTFVPLPTSMPGGIYNISIGAYDATNNVRMGVLDDEQQRGTRLFVGQISVARR